MYTMKVSCAGCHPVLGSVQRIRTVVPPHGLHAQERGWGMDLLQREEGQGLVEYALILVFIAIVVIAVLVLFGPALSEYYELIVNMFP